MKTMRKLACLLLALTMLLALSATAFAQTVDTGAGGTAKITITNAAKGETYKIYKLFSATVTGTENGSIAYTGTIPDALTDYFEANASTGYISVKDSIDNTALFGALKTWAATATPVIADGTQSDGSALEFTGLEYGYYVVTSTQGTSAITVTSTNPNATIVDKNSTTPYIPAGKDLKQVDDTDVTIGQKLTYTITFNTANFEGAGENAKRILSYTITDTLPNFLSNATVTGFTIGGTDYKPDSNNFPQFGTDGKITIPWVSSDATSGYTSLYANNAQIVVTYEATVTDDAVIDGNGNKNEVTITWDTADGTSTTKLEDDVTVYTYAIALKKVNNEGTALPGATFQFPFYVKATADDDGAYIYAGTTAPSAGDTSIVNTITTPASGEIVVKGVATGTYSVTETNAPAGYNKLDTAVSVEAAKIGQTTTNVTKYIDKQGNVVDTQTGEAVTVTYTNDALAASTVFVVNMTGSVLPSTGGTGTTILYILGTLMVLGAGVLLVVRRRVNAE